MAKIVIIGAGSGFGGRLSKDIMAHPALQNSTICLCDLHEGRLNQVKNYVQRIIDRYNLPTKIECGTDRTKFLPGADFVITSISAGGGAYYGSPYKEEINIPRKYGIEQSVGDTYSVGSIFRLLRTGPVQMQVCRDMEKYCPNALLLNHTNPMAGLTMLHSLSSGIRNVGLCHGVVGTTFVLASALNMKSEELACKVAGINHLSWYLELKKADGGQDLYPQLKEAIKNTSDENIAQFLKEQTVRVEIMKNFGYFPTESNHHDSEYLPYFRRTPQLLEKYALAKKNVPDQYPGERGWLTETEKEETLDKLEASVEYTSSIMNAVVTGTPYKFTGNVMNNGLITNLPSKVCVEVPCVADTHGITPCYIGDLPTHLAGFDRTCITPIQIAVESILERDKEKAFYAVAQDVNVAANVGLDDIRKMFNELWEAEGDLLNWFKDGSVVERCAEN